MLRGTLIVIMLCWASTVDAFGPCGEEEHYRSSDGSCVHVPCQTSEHVQGEIAVCRDGAHSVSHITRAHARITAGSSIGIRAT